MHKQEVAMDLIYKFGLLSPNISLELLCLVSVVGKVGVVIMRHKALCGMTKKYARKNASNGTMIGCDCVQREVVLVHENTCCGC